MGWSTGWDAPAAVAASSLTVNPGDPGIDVNAPGILTLGEANATSVDVDVPLAVVGSVTTVAASLGNFVLGDATAVFGWSGASAIRNGAGVPAVGLGVDRDLYIRTDGASGAAVYYKRGGAWNPLTGG